MEFKWRNIEWPLGDNAKNAPLGRWQINQNFMPVIFKVILNLQGWQGAREIVQHVRNLPGMQLVQSFLLHMVSETPQGVNSEHRSDISPEQVGCGPSKKKKRNKADEGWCWVGFSSGSSKKEEVNWPWGLSLHYVKNREYLEEVERSKEAVVRKICATEILLKKYFFGIYNTGYIKMQNAGVCWSDTPMNRCLSCM